MIKNLNEYQEVILMKNKGIRFFELFFYSIDNNIKLFFGYQSIFQCMYVYRLKL